MTENVNTYVLPKDSTTLLLQVLPITDPLAVAWGVLSVDEKIGFLNAAIRKLEDLNYAGERAYYRQPLKFPRIARNHPVEFTSAPVEVKQAQVVWAAEIMRQELFVNRRNNAACVALGIIKDEPITEPKIPPRVEELLHRWLTSWRRM